MRRLIVLSMVLLLAACSPSDGESETSSAPSSTTSTAVPESTTTTALPDFDVTSPAFGDGESIPTEYTCDGADVSPELNLVGIPEDTASLVMLVEDPDAPLGTWTHWLESDIIAGSGSFDFPRDASLLGVPGVNSWNLEGYMGPCPPAGEDHTYFYTVYALDTLLELPAGVDVETVTEAMDGHIIDTVELTGTYAR